MLKMFSIYDCKAEIWLQPFYAIASGAAVRMFEQVVNDPASEFSKFPADYTLFEIGYFDGASGTVSGLEAHINLGVGLEYVRSSNVVELKRDAR